MQETWRDAMIIQAVDDQLKLKIIIVETHEEFSEYSIIQPVSSKLHWFRNRYYIGHCQPVASHCSR